MSEGKGGFGPGFVISAAFVGPGTVITCTAAGIQFGAALLWTLLFAGVTTYVLQEMSLRLSLAGDHDLAESMGKLLPGKLGPALAWLVAIGIVTGCIAYQSGNLIGGASGAAIFFNVPTSALVIIQAVLAFALLWTGTYALIEKALMALVAVMGIAFIGTALLNPPAMFDVISGIFVPSLPNGSLLTVIALVGTTVVPYNLFLHARIAREKWAHGAGDGAIGWARKDLLLGVAIGIAVSLGIMASSAAGLQGAGISSVSSMAGPLRDRFGDLGAFIFGVGLWSAGMTSAITAPLAAGYTLVGAAGKRENSAMLFRITWIVVLLAGVLFALTGINPIALIVAAQAFNGMILPLAAFFLIIALNRKSLGRWKNGVLANAAGGAVLLIVLLLASRYLLRAIGLW